MRVAIFTDNDFDKVNGVTTALTALVDRAPRDVSPRIYTASTLGTDTPDYLALPSLAIPIPFYSEMNVYLPRYRHYLRRVVEDRIDVLHLTTPGPMGLTALWVAARTGLPLVGSFHTDLAAYVSILSGSATLGRCMSQLMRWIYGRCARTLVPSAATRELLLQTAACGDRIVLWPRGVDTSFFTPARRSLRMRDAWRVGDRDRVILYVGRLSREKGLAMLPEVLYRLRALGVSHRMVIAGDGPLRRTLATQLPDAVFMGVVTRAQVAEVFASADAFVFPSETDTAGNVVLEAQASGLPVVVSDRGGPREHMRPGVTGIVCGGNVKHWAQAVAGLCLREESRQDMGRAAREFAVGRSWESTLASVYQTYREVCVVAPRSPRLQHRAA